MHTVHVHAFIVDFNEGQTGYQKYQTNQHTDQNCNGQIEDDGCKHGCRKFEHCALEFMGEDIADGFPFVHSPCRYHQHPCQSRQRNPGHDGSQQEHGDQKPNGMEHAGQSCFCAGFDGNTGTRDCCGCGNAAEEGQQDIPDPLCNQLLIGIQTHARHAPCGCAAKQAFNHAQNGNGKRRCDQCADGFQIQRAKQQTIFGNQCFGDFPNHSNIQLHENGKRSGEDDADKRGRDNGVPFFRKEYHKQNHEQPQTDSGQIGGEAKARIAEQLADGRGSLGMCSEEVVNLPQGDDNGDTGGKACDNGGGDEGGQLAQMQNPCQKQDDARNQRCDKYAVHPIGCNQRHQNCRHGTRRSGNLIIAAGKQAHNQPGNDGSD